MDTDVVSYVFKHDTRGRDFAPLLLGRSVAVSFMTVAELRLWARSRDWGPVRRDELETFLDRYAVLPWSDEASTLWAEVTDVARRAGRRIQTADAWIAATAIQYGLPLVTHNPKDYAGIERLRLLTA